MPSVAIREFSNGEKLDRALARHQHNGPQFGDPLKILLRYEAEAEEHYNPRLPASRSAQIRSFINFKFQLHYSTR